MKQMIILYTLLVCSLIKSSEQATYLNSFLSGFAEMAQEQQKQEVANFVAAMISDKCISYQEFINKMHVNRYKDEVYLFMQIANRQTFDQVTRQEYLDARDRSLKRYQARELVYAMQTALIILGKARESGCLEVQGYVSTILDRLYERRDQLPIDSHHMFKPGQWRKPSIDRSNNSKRPKKDFIGNDWLVC